MTVNGSLRASWVEEQHQSASRCSNQVREEEDPDRNRKLRECLIFMWTTGAPFVFMEKRLKHGGAETRTPAAPLQFKNSSIKI